MDDYVKELEKMEETSWPLMKWEKKS
jgi:hypothetical protein